MELTKRQTVNLYVRVHLTLMLSSVIQLISGTLNLVSFGAFSLLNKEAYNNLVEQIKEYMYEHRD